MRKHLIIPNFFALVILMAACSENKQTFSVRIQCEAEYDDIEIFLTREVNGDMWELTEKDGMVDFGTLEEGKYILQVNTFRDGMIRPSLALSRAFMVPLVNPEDLLRLPRPMHLSEVRFQTSGEDSETWVTLADGGCQKATEVSLYGSHSLPVEEKEENLITRTTYANPLIFSLDMARSSMNLIVVTTQADKAGGFVTRSEVFKLAVEGTNFHSISAGELYPYSMGAGPFFFFAEVEEGKLYSVEILDEFNSGYSGSGAVLSAYDSGGRRFFEARTAAPKGSPRHFIARSSEMMRFRVDIAVEGHGGDFAIRYIDLSPLPALDYDTNYHFSVNGETRVATTELIPGNYLIKTQFSEPEGMFVYYSIYNAATLDLMGDLSHIGPYASGDTNSTTHNLKISDNPQTIMMVMTSAFHGDPNTFSLKIE